MSTDLSTNFKIRTVKSKVSLFCYFLILSASYFKPGKLLIILTHCFNFSLLEKEFLNFSLSKILKDSSNCFIIYYCNLEF